MRHVSLPANQYVQFGNVQIVEHTVSVDIRDPGIGDGGGALIHAVELCHIEVVHNAVRVDISLNKRDHGVVRAKEPPGHRIAVCIRDLCDGGIRVEGTMRTDGDPLIYGQRDRGDPFLRRVHLLTAREYGYAAATVREYGYIDGTLSDRLSVHDLRDRHILRGVDGPWDTHDHPDP